MNKSIVFAFTLLLGGSLLFSEKPALGKPDKGFLTEKKIRPKFPLHWGKPPQAQTKDLVDLPGKFGKGSSTLASWIKEKIEDDISNGKPNLTDNSSGKEKFNRIEIEKETLQAVREGKITKEEARKKLDALRKDMADNGERKRPKRPQKPEISDEVKAQIDAVKDLEKALHTEIKEKVNELGKDATREEIKATVESFKESNKNRFEEIKEAHTAIRENIEANRPEKPERPELTEDLKAKVDALHAKRKEMHEAQKELHQNLKEASKEEREVLITAFKEANKAKHEEIKTQAKEVKEEIRSLVETEATRTSDL
jgi:chromosome segregation ATPase